ncbi:MAG: NTP transferase domain-containing protein [Bacteroidetes bacterium]|nr:NTP transferase domain-containing protein [Bacteroidota bacterium]
MGNHRKHGNEVRVRTGNFARNEIAFLGTPCEVIQNLSEQIISDLSDNFRIDYLDADHKKADQPEFLSQGAEAFHEVVNDSFLKTIQKVGNDFDNKFHYLQTDLLLINGNHFVAENQIVFLDKRKTESICRKTERLTNILCFIDVDGDRNIPDCIRELPVDISEIPVFKLSNGKAISEFIHQFTNAKKPELKGLILVGGKSSRMGEDKSDLHYHGMPQHQYIRELLKPFCSEIFYGVNKDQQQFDESEIIRDSFLDMGPLASILSALRSHPEAAWLVIACDIPLIDENIINQLVDQRNPKKFATAFRKTDADFPEPLFAIWEPKSYSRILSFLSLGYQCPRKVLINSDVELITANTPEWVFNANTPEEKETALQLIRERL